MQRGIIIASFGTTHEDTRRRTIDKIEDQIRMEFNEDTCIRAFTSKVVISRILKKEKIKIFNEVEALEKLRDLGIKDNNIYIQPLHIIPAIEYEKLLALGIKNVGRPLIYNEESIDQVIETLDFNITNKESLVLFGHGSSHKNDYLYELFNQRLKVKGYDNIFMVTAEGKIQIEDVIEPLKKVGNKKVYLQPFMIVAGEHAKVDMASNKEGSLKQVLSSHGFKVESRLIGLGEYESLGRIFIKNLHEVMNI